MAEDPVPAVRRHAAAIVAGVVGFIVLLILLSAIGGMIADSKRNRMLNAWDDTLGGFEQIIERYPEREANDSALRVEQLSAELGIDVTPHGIAGEGRARPGSTAADRYKNARRAINDYADDQLERAVSSVDPPPEAARRFLEENRSTLEALRGLLLEGEPPLWELRLREAYYATEVPNLLGYTNLQRLLMADLLSRLSDGDPDGALTTLEAAWRLNQALRDTPLLISQLQALGSARQHVGALRRFERVPRSWSDRIYEHDYRESVLTSLQVEGWAWIHTFDPKSDVLPPGASSSFLYRAAGPYLVYCVADIGDEWRRRLVELSELESFCDRDLATSDVDLNLEPPGWNLLGRTIFGNLNEVPKRVARFELDREMTAKLLELRQARDEAGGRWPDEIPGIVSSTTCPDDRWIYEKTPDGEVSLAFSREVQWEGFRGVRLPLRQVANR